MSLLFGVKNRWLSFIFLICVALLCKKSGMQTCTREEDVFRNQTSTVLLRLHRFIVHLQDSLPVRSGLLEAASIKKNRTQKKRNETQKRIWVVMRLQQWQSVCQVRLSRPRTKELGSDGPERLSGAGLKARSRRSLHHFPIPRLFRVDFALQLHSWGKTDASSAAASPPLLPLCRLSSPSPLCPLGLFYGRASNMWPLPCIRLHVHNQTARIKPSRLIMCKDGFPNVYSPPQSRPVSPARQILDRFQRR